ncbi:Paraplegin [Trichoplax sp. H2]|nr:Paraplegin [Trichoplax sp. H2]|eukprot:RDD47073.1 Paraplegin [Trichoplax sp. H2]
MTNMYLVSSTIRCCYRIHNNLRIGYRTLSYFTGNNYVHSNGHHGASSGRHRIHNGLSHLNICQISVTTHPIRNFLTIFQRPWLLANLHKALQLNPQTLPLANKWASQILFNLTTKYDRILWNKDEKFFETNQDHDQKNRHTNTDGDGKNENNNNNNNGQFEQQNMPAWQNLILWMIIMYYLLGNEDLVPQISWSTFYKEILVTGEVRHLEINKSHDRVDVYLHDGAFISGKKISRPGPHFCFSIPSAEMFEEKLVEAQKEIGITHNEYIPVTYQADSIFDQIAWPMMLTVVMLGFIYLAFSRRRPNIKTGKFTKFGLAKPTIVEHPVGNINFSKVAGMQEAKQEISEFVQYLKSPQKFKELGARIPKGALLTGPPGTGKTLLAKAVANESQVPFLSMAGSDFVEVFAGVGAARVRDLFKQARGRSPKTMGGHGEQENTLNQLLVEMDGMQSLDGVIVLASTNRVDILDEALLRPGRFDRTITIDLPTMSERIDIFKLYLSNYVLKKKPDHYAQRLAELTPGKSGADIANICNEAALHAARSSESSVDKKNFDYAIERVIVGMAKKSASISPHERKVIAFHEAGHALTSWLLEHTDPLLKVSIAPRTKSALGYTQSLPSDRKLYSREQIFDIMCTTLGGRAAEMLKFKTITTGAEDDLKKVTDLAYKQIVECGMNDTIGHLSFRIKKPGEWGKKPYSDKLAHIIDTEVSQLIRRAYIRTEEILTDNMDKLEKLANKLLKDEVLHQEDIVKVIGPPSYPYKIRDRSLSEDQFS